MIISCKDTVLLNRLVSRLTTIVLELTPSYDRERDGASLASSMWTLTVRYTPIPIESASKPGPKLALDAGTRIESTFPINTAFIMMSV